MEVQRSSAPAVAYGRYLKGKQTQVLRSVGAPTSALTHQYSVSFNGFTANCAAITDRGSIWDTSPELYDRMLAINLKAPFFIMQDAVHLMRKTATKGTIVNILSMSGHGGQSFLSAYSMSKGALATLTKNVAYTVMGHHIRVNGLAIGWMDTPGEDRIMKTYHGADDGWLAKAEATRPFGRLLKPAEVARAVAYLSSAESGLMTGAIIDFDQQVLGAGELEEATDQRVGAVDFFGDEAGHLFGK